MNTIEDKATTRPWETFTTGNYELGGSNARKGWSIGICGPSRSKEQNVCTIDCGNAELEHEYERQKDDAKLIVKAVNSHETLIASIQKVAEIRRSILFVLSSSQFPPKLVPGMEAICEELEETITKAQA